jgi:hypothetical protein
MANKPHKRVISFSTARASSMSSVPTPEEYRGLVYEWIAIGQSMPPEHLRLAVGDMREWSSGLPQAGVVLPFRAP